MSNQPPTISPAKYRHPAITYEQQWIMPLVNYYNEIAKPMNRDPPMDTIRFKNLLKEYSTGQEVLLKFQGKNAEYKWSVENHPQAEGRVVPDDSCELVTTPFVAARELRRVLREVHTWLLSVKDGKVPDIELERNAERSWAVDEIEVADMSALDEVLRVNRENGWDF